MTDDLDIRHQFKILQDQNARVLEELAGQRDILCGLLEHLKAIQGRNDRADAAANTAGNLPIGVFDQTAADQSRWG